MTWSAAWAWMDEAAGTCARAFFPVRIGIAEDEATGSAATKLWRTSGRADRDPPGPRLAHPRPPRDGGVEIGGLSVVDEVRDYALP